MQAMSVHEIQRNKDKKYRLDTCGGSIDNKQRTNRRVHLGHLRWKPAGECHNTRTLCAFDEWMNVSQARYKQAHAYCVSVAFMCLYVCISFTLTMQHTKDTTWVSPWAEVTGATLLHTDVAHNVQGGLGTGPHPVNLQGAEQIPGAATNI